MSQHCRTFLLRTMVGGAALIGGLLFSGCSSDGIGAPVGATAAVTAEPIDACALLSRPEVEQMVGFSVTAVPAGGVLEGGSACHYIRTGDDDSQYVVRLVADTDPARFDPGAVHDAVPLSGLGDEAYQGTLVGDPFIGVRAGERSATLTGDHTVAGVDAASLTTLARSVAAQLAAADAD